MDPLKFTTVAHATHRYLSPLSKAKSAWLIERLALAASARVLDIGCGAGAFLVDLVEATGATGVGVDINAAFIDRARAQARARGVDERIEWRRERLVDAIAPGERYDAIVCLGASQAIGSFAQALAWAFDMLHPGRVALFGDGFWQRPPDEAYLRVLGATVDELTTHAGNAQRARDAGFRVLATTAAGTDEWDDYEGRYAAAVERYVAARPQDPDTPAMAERIRAWHDAYLRHGRDTLGFGFYVLLRP